VAFLFTSLLNDGFCGNWNSVLFQNVDLLKQFISPYTGQVESYSKTGKYSIVTVV